MFQNEDPPHPNYLKFMLVDIKTREVMHEWEPVRIEPGELIAIDGLPITVKV